LLCLGIVGASTDALSSFSDAADIVIDRDTAGLVAVLQMQEALYSAADSERKLIATGAAMLRAKLAKLVPNRQRMPNYSAESSKNSLHDRRRPNQNACFF
jgi:hypothetical protein